MPSISHVENHFTSSEFVRDIVIGMADGLTVPFALAAGLTGIAAASTGIVVTAGLAEIAAGSIAMGLGGYLAARTDMEHYDHELKREQEEIINTPEMEEQEIVDVFAEYGLTRSQILPVVDALKSNPGKWVDFMMKFELGLEKTEPKRARNSALTIAVSYIIGGMIPLAPYIFIESIASALVYSVIFTLIALFLFGYIKGSFTGLKPLIGGLRTVLIGGLAAGAAFVIARLIS
ncbi:MAG: iron transporter [Ignavibacteriae bacterium HGW-Ignavibacteriae-3]|nr:MAG: iron transporter [Ignavibacteriae bacterium HGW-Ignavibacteriae-3]